ncbi:MAG: FtsX-like permease family protein [Desulfobulbus sp.]|nr:FtsX-like permease family protein [Desulfobulbus sp.]
MILKLAYKDVVHDRLLSVCLVLAIASIIAPLLILFGLQFGTIETMRNRLVQDPKNREIRPMTTKTFSRDWFDQLKGRCPEVSFVVPMTRQISSSIVAVNEVADLRESLSLVATAPGDPLLFENGVTVPGNDGCVLSTPAAQALNVKVGDQLSFTAQRIIQGKYENGSFSVKVRGVLEERASSLKMAYLPLEVIEAVEDFKDGRAVPAFGWQGELPAAYPVFEGAVVLVPEPLSKLDEVLLINNTGFSQVKSLTGADLTTILGHAPAENWAAYQLTVKHGSVGDTSLRALSNKLRGRGARIIPWIEPLPIDLHSAAEGGHGAHNLLLQLSIAQDDAVLVGGQPPLETEARSGGLGSMKTVLVAADLPIAEGPAALTLTLGERVLTVPVVVQKGVVDKGRAFVSAPFAGMLNLLRYRNVRYDAQIDALLLSRQGYAGFRLYTASIDAVERVQKFLESEGISVNTERERIAEVRRLDHYTSLIFWLIASVGVVGGISALTASLYASVERKKKELNVLRLLGLLKKELVFFPIAQGLLLSSGALMLSVAIFVTVAQVINQLFRTQLRTTESLCTLSWGHFVLLFVGVWSLSIIAATFAALRATRLDPAEALRDE